MIPRLPPPPFVIVDLSSLWSIKSKITFAVGR
jgi:hypothetical protein